MPRVFARDVVCWGRDSERRRLLTVNSLEAGLHVGAPRAEQTYRRLTRPSSISPAW
jgi:hypothetical protein